MIGRGIVLALGLGIIAFGGSTLHCVFSEHETQCAARGARDARSRRLSDADASAKHLTWPSQCSRHEWLGMMKCQFAPLSTGCHEGRDAWYDAGCLCDYDQYLWKGATPIGYVWTMMALGKTYPEMAAESGCLEDTTLCKPPSDGDVRLSAYGKDTAGALEVYAGGDWLQAVGTLSNASATAVCGRLGFKVGALRSKPVAGDGLVWDGGATMLALGADAAAPHPSDLLALRRQPSEAEAATPMPRVRLECDVSGVAGCYFRADGVRVCVVDGKARTRADYPEGRPTMACGTAGSFFLTPELAVRQGLADSHVLGGPRGACDAEKQAWARTCHGAMLIALLCWLGAVSFVASCIGFAGLRGGPGRRWSSVSGGGASGNSDSAPLREGADERAHAARSDAPEHAQQRQLADGDSRQSTSLAAAGGGPVAPGCCVCQ